MEQLGKAGVSSGPMDNIRSLESVFFFHVSHNMAKFPPLTDIETLNDRVEGGPVLLGRNPLWSGTLWVVGARQRNGGWISSNSDCHGNSGDDGTVTRSSERLQGTFFDSGGMLL
jgi:hypothetical protein